MRGALSLVMKVSVFLGSVLCFRVKVCGAGGGFGPERRQLRPVRELQDKQKGLYRLPKPLLVVVPASFKAAPHVKCPHFVSAKHCQLRSAVRNLPYQ